MTDGAGNEGVTEENPMVTKETVEKAGQEIGDLVVLVLDDVSNREQLAQFTVEGFQAVQAVAGIGIPTEHKAAVASHLLEKILARVNERVLTLP